MNLRTTRHRRLVTRVLTAAALVCLAGPLQAQEAGYAPSAKAEAAPAGDAQPADAQPAEAPAGYLPVTVRVVQGPEGEPVADAPVELRAARPKGPFEPTDPEPARRWNARTDASGEVTFTDVPASLATSGLRLHAVGAFGGINFKSDTIVASPGAALEVRVYETVFEPKGIAVDSLRTVVRPWEDFLMFNQMWTLTVDGEHAVDTGALSGKQYERGIPLELPLDARQIQVRGPGTSEVVNSTIYWKGVLKPGETVPLQVGFSMPAEDPEFTYAHEMAYPVRAAEIVVPVETDYAKVPRLDDLELAAPGFEDMQAGLGAGGLRPDKEFVVARGASFEPGQTLRFKLYGLPFERPVGPWVALGLGLLGALGVFAFARREDVQPEAEATAADVLREEREALLDELVALETDRREGYVDRAEYERESTLLRERLALVLKKLDDLDTAS